MRPPHRPSGRSRITAPARLLLVLPLLTGVLIVEAVFAARGESGDLISVPAAGIGMLLLWVGIAWALRSWVALLMTFAPATMIILGAAMIGDLAPGSGAALLLVGISLMATIILFRLSSPVPRPTIPPAWQSGLGASTTSLGTTSPGSRSTGPTPAGTAAAAGDLGAARGSRAPAHGDLAGQADDFAGTDPAADGFADGDFVGDEAAERAARASDTSATDRAARDRLVALLCRRGGAAGPTLATLEEFFTGNGDPRSIAPRLRGAVPLRDFRSALHRLRCRAGVAEVLMQVDPLQAGRYPGGEWPAAGGVHLVATVGPDEMDRLAAPLRTEAIIGPLPVNELAAGGPAPAGSGEYALWWD